MKSSALFVIILLCANMNAFLFGYNFYNGEYLKAIAYALMTIAVAVVGYRTLNRQSLVEKRKND